MFIWPALETVAWSWSDETSSFIHPYITIGRCSSRPSRNCLLRYTVSFVTTSTSTNYCFCLPSENMNGNAHSLGSSFDKISPENNVPQTNKHANHYHLSSAKPRDHVNSYHEREHRPESMENNGSQYKIAANSMTSHTHVHQHPPNQQQHIIINNEKRFKNYKLVSDPLLRKGAQKVYRYDGVPTTPVS